MKMDVDVGVVSEQTSSRRSWWKKGSCQFGCSTADIPMIPSHRRLRVQSVGGLYLFMVSGMVTIATAYYSGYGFSIFLKNMRSGGRSVLRMCSRRSERNIATAYPYRDKSAAIGSLLVGLHGGDGERVDERHEVTRGMVEKNAVAGPSSPPPPGISLTNGTLQVDGTP